MSKNDKYGLIDTDISTSTYDNNYIIKSPKYHYNSDSSFILSTNSSSSSIKKQQYNTKDLNSTKLQQTSKIHNKKERKGYTKHQSNFKQYVDKYIAKRETIKSIITSRRMSPEAYTIMNPKSPTKKKRNNRPRCSHIKTNHIQLEGTSKHMNSNVAPPISLKSSSDVRHKKQIHKQSNNKVSKPWKIFQTQCNSEKTSNNDGHYKDAIPIDNEGKDNLVHSISHHSSKQSRAQTNRIKSLWRSYLRMTQHNMYTVSLSGESQFS